MQVLQPWIWLFRVLLKRDRGLNIVSCWRRSIDVVILEKSNRALFGLWHSGINNAKWPRNFLQYTIHSLLDRVTMVMLESFPFPFKFLMPNPCLSHLLLYLHLRSEIIQSHILISTDSLLSELSVYTHSDARGNQDNGCQQEENFG